MRCPTSPELPPLPAGKTGWPWTVEGPKLPDTMPGGKPWPRISIVTPSYNQGKFIEETIRSVLLQGYPDLEYIIIDGGSTDDSVEIIKKYEARLSYWISEEDRGQSHAINKGFTTCTGQLMGWLNSDDMLLPNCLFNIAREHTDNRATLFTGGMLALLEPQDQIIVARAAEFGLRPTASAILARAPHLHQSSTFWSRTLWEAVGCHVSEDLHYAMDADLWLRMALKDPLFIVVDEPISIFRRHTQQKTATFDPYQQELATVRKQYSSLIRESFRHKFLYFLWKHLGDFLKHRNSHPTLGLVPPGYGCDYKQVLGRSQVQSVEKN